MQPARDRAVRTDHQFRAGREPDVGFGGCHGAGQSRRDIGRRWEQPAIGGEQVAEARRVHPSLRVRRAEQGDGVGADRCRARQAGRGVGRMPIEPPEHMGQRRGGLRMPTWREQDQPQIRRHELGPDSVVRCNLQVSAVHVD